MDARRVARDLGRRRRVCQGWRRRLASVAVAARERVDNGEGMVAVTAQKVFGG